MKLSRKKKEVVNVDHTDEGIMGSDKGVPIGDLVPGETRAFEVGPPEVTSTENTKDGKFITTNEGNPATPGQKLLTVETDPEREKFIRQNELLVIKREKE